MQVGILHRNVLVVTSWDDFRMPYRPLVIFCRSAAPNGINSCKARQIASSTVCKWNSHSWESKHAEETLATASVAVVDSIFDRVCRWRLWRECGRWMRRRKLRKFSAFDERLPSRHAHSIGEWFVWCAHDRTRRLFSCVFGSRATADTCAASLSDASRRAIETGWRTPQVSPFRWLEWLGRTSCAQTTNLRGHRG